MNFKKIPTYETPDYEMEINRNEKYSLLRHTNIKNNM